MQNAHVATTMPFLFPGHVQPGLNIEYPNGNKHYHGRPVVPAADYFLLEVSLRTWRSPRAPSPNHMSGIDSHDAETLVISNDETLFMMRNINRDIVIPRDTRKLYIVEVRWLSNLPCLRILQNLVVLELDDIPVRTLPSLEPLLNLEDLTLRELHEMEDMPLGIGDAPKLGSLSISSLTSLRSFSVAFIRRLTSTDTRYTSSTNPQRLKYLRLERCRYAVVPEEIKELTGLTELWLMECGSQGPELQCFPDIGRSLGHLHTLYVCGFPQFLWLPEDLSGLTSMRFLYLENMGLQSIPRSIGCMTSLVKLILHKLAVDTIPREVAALKRLEELSIRDCTRLLECEISLCGQFPLLTHLEFSLVVDNETNMYQRIIEMLPSTRNLLVLRIFGAPPDAVCAITDGLMAYTAPDLTSLVLDDDAYDYWRSLFPVEYHPLPMNMDSIGDEHLTLMQAMHGGDRWDDALHPFDLRDVFLVMMNEWVAEERKIKTFAWSQHQRLGAGSHAAKLDNVSLNLVLEIAMGRTAFR